tara:strand:- start:747 stop:2165 length:1419 start_codon:yes stop_codon:yes gene_type:complete
MNRGIGRYVYALGDLIVSALSWMLFFFFRKVEIEGLAISSEVWWAMFSDIKFQIGCITIPLFWVALHYTFSSYKDVFRKSRFKELKRIFVLTLSGCILLFFSILLDDLIYDFTAYYYTFFALFSIQFIALLIWRIPITSYSKNLVKKGDIIFKSIVLGGSKKALECYQELAQNTTSMGHQFLGFVKINGEACPLENELTCLGQSNAIENIIVENEIEEVIIAIESSEHPKLQNILLQLANCNVVIKITPDLFDIMSGHVRINNVFGTPLIEIYPDLLPKWQKILKRIIDIFGSISALIILFPLLIYVAVRVKLSSKGPIFYKQERIGKGGKVFKIIKFRSMFTNAESRGPTLASTNDSRITKWGKTMRALRLDELPQFYNVLIGEMALVGPRPERQYYIDQIIQHAPHYRFLHKVRPGITSLGQVKFGYASDIKQMLKRLKFDILYIENMSLALDFKIMFYTLFTVIRKQGQ